MTEVVFFIMIILCMISYRGLRDKKVIYDSLECILKCLHYIIRGQFSDKELQEALTKYIESTVKEINEVQK